MKLGLVLEGGALRGLFTAGVIDVLLENDIKFDGVIGVSAGACFGCNYVTRQHGRVIRYNTRFAKDKRYCSISSLIKTGDIFGAEFCYHTLPEELDVFDYEEYLRSETDFYVVATDVLTGKAVYRKLDTLGREDIEWMRASASMPLVSRIVEIDGGKYLDGGIADSIPAKAFNQMGYDALVTVLTKPRGYRKSSNKAMPLVKMFYKDYPEFIKAMEERHIAYNGQLQDVFDLEKQGNNFVICPKVPLRIGHISHNPNEMMDAYETGRNIAIEMLPSLYRFIESKVE